MTDLREAIKSDLAEIAGNPLRDSTTALLATLGYKSDRTISLANSNPTAFLDFIRNQPSEVAFNEAKALFDDWKSADLLFQLTDEELSDHASLFKETSVAPGLLRSYVFFAIELTGDSYARSKLTDIARQINRVFPMPVMVLIKHIADKQPVLSIAVINRRQNRRDTARDVLGKVTIIRDISLSAPHRGHLDILASFALPNLVHPQRQPINDFDTLHAAWEDIFNVELLNKRFYRELANWYFWALPQVEFPADTEEDDEKRRATSLIRLLTRLIFCWFLKEKGLIPETLFNAADLKKILKDLDSATSTYHQAILQNLFFATLNQRMGKDKSGKPYRAFAHDEGFLKNRATYGVDTLYRYEDQFRDPEQALGYFADVPFLNGGLFECLDRTEEGTGRKLYVDGFSRNPRKRPKVPNDLFFASERAIDLSDAYGEPRRRNEKVRGLLNILHSYKFTIVENTPIDQEIALDPELLGKVFENLLASYNDETKTTARKQTGSFYTPRPIVQYMVDESLKAHLSGALKKKGLSQEDVDVGLDILFAYTEREHPFNETETDALLDAIHTCKILDLACGSGAFPMGALHKLVYIIHKLDPDNAKWKQLQIAAASKIPDPSSRDAAIEAVERDFSENPDDYGRKLYLIENCLYGVDIQPIAIQISKLRFFISLVCDQRTNRSKKVNHGIRPLPNLETKFVAADSLIELKVPNQGELFASPKVKTLEAELQRVRHEYFAATTRQRKLSLQKRDRELRDKLAEALTQGTFANQEASHKLADWNPYDPRQAADFFEPLWMFDQSVADGFDIILGNPPYISVEKFARTALQAEWKESFATFAARGDVYCLFYERGFDLLREGGVLAYITSNKFMRAGYGKPLRKYLVSQQINVLIDFCELPVFEAATDPIIVVATKATDDGKRSFPVLVVKDETEFTSLSDSIFARSSKYTAGDLKIEGWSLEGRSGLALVDKLRAKAVPLLRHVNNQLYYGIKTGLNEAFIIDRATREKLIREDANSLALIKPWVRGRDIKRWTHEYHDLYVVIVPYGFHAELKHYPAIRRHLTSYGEKLKARGQCQSSRDGATEGQHHWLELDNNPSASYIASFETPKIVLADIGKRLKASWSEPGCFIGNTGYIIANADPFTLAVLLGTVTDWYARMTFQGLGDPWEGGRMRFVHRNLATIPIPLASAEDKAILTRLAEQATKSAMAGENGAVAKIERSIDEIVYRLFELTPEEIAHIESALLSTRSQNPGADPDTTQRPGRTG